MPSLAISANRDDPRTLIVVFLRGGADGLSLVPPVGDDDYQRARPRIAMAKGEGVKLDDRFALNPLLADLERFYRDGQLAVIHAAGSEDGTRSHFEAQDLMEHGGPAIGGGWLGRWLRLRERPAGAVGGALSAIAVEAALPECLRGAPAATALRSLADLSLGDDAERLRDPLADLYAGDDLLGGAATEALDALKRIGRLRLTEYRPEHGAEYAADDFAHGLRLVAQLIKARVGLEVACVDLPGWDSHFVQGSVIEPRMRSLGAGLAAFAADLGPLLATTSVVVMSEFGRRVRENSSLGTDHGRGGAMFVLGGGTPGGMHCRWPGLSDEILDGPGDLPVAHNYRDVLVPVLARHGSQTAAQRAFPGFALEPLPV